MNQKEFEELLIKYREGNCSETEKLHIERWYWEYNEYETGLTEASIAAARLEVLERLPKAIPEKKLKYPFRIPLIAACTLLVVGISFYLLKRNKPLTETVIAQDVKPGGYKAILILANGTNIDLNEVNEGEIAKDKGINIIKLPEGQLQFKADHTVSAEQKPDTLSGLVSAPRLVKQGSGLNVVLTPKGGQYHIALPDGTNVWINAGSTLRFPSSFEDMPERRVHLTGEAYFEVAQVKTVFGMQKRARKVPFIVQTGKQEITVLGTHFNVNSYDDEPNVKTTLLEGMVKVSSNSEDEVIKPGQQAINDGSAIIVKRADTEMAVAWKNGEFMFARENLKSIMRKVKRWYNVEVAYTNPEIGNKPFSGTISKFKNVSEVLNLLEVTGEVKFKIEGRKITVLR